MKHFLTFSLTLFTFFTIVSCQTPSEKGGTIELLAPVAFMDAYEAEPGAHLIDCRTPGEVSRGKVRDAMNIDFRSPDFSAQVEKLDKDKPVYIYCQVGGRSAAAARKMKSLGFEEVHDMQGGYRAYKKQ